LKSSLAFEGTVGTQWLKALGFVDDSILDLKPVLNSKFKNRVHGSN